MKRYKISVLAREDLINIWKYVSETNEQAADKIIDSFMERFLLISEFPQLGRERNELMEGMRSFPWKRYIIFYSVKGETIEVFRVLHGARDIEEIFDVSGE